MRCFEDGLNAEELDVRPFKFKHKLVGHPALTLANLAEALPALPNEQVYYSSGLLEKTDDFDRAHLDKKNGLTLEQTVETLRTSSSYIMVRSPEAHPSFKPVFGELVADVETLMHQRGVGNNAVGPTLYLFIASPDSLTPFHIDRYSTFLLQFAGTKEVVVFPPGDDRVVPARDCEAFIAHSGDRPVWRPEAEPLGTRFQFAPGEAIHIPFVAGHYVKNGPADVSISMSVIFNTPHTVALTKAMLFNHYVRRALRPVGWNPTPVGNAGWRDTTKAQLWSTAARVAKIVRRA